MIQEDVVHYFSCKARLHVCVKFPGCYEDDRLVTLYGCHFQLLLIDLKDKLIFKIQMALKQNVHVKIKQCTST